LTRRRPFRDDERGGGVSVNGAEDSAAGAAACSEEEDREKRGGKSVGCDSRSTRLPTTDAASLYRFSPLSLER
jgi:hypothetical protein